MKIKINQREIPLDPTQVKAAKKVVLHFLDKEKKIENKHMNPTWYLTVLIVMHSLSGELLNSYSPDNLERIFSAFAKKEEDE